MTDKTDIEALRDKHELALKDLTERLTECNRLNFCMDELSAFAAFSSTVIDQLETERQRANYGQQVIDQRNAECDRLVNELAALRGDQEPVAIMDIQHGREDGNIFAVVLTKAGHALKDDAYELFTRQPKPVVVLPKITTERAEWTTWQWIEHLGGRFQHGNPGDYIEFGSVFAVQQMLKQFQRTSMAIMITEIRAMLESAGVVVKDGE